MATVSRWAMLVGVTLVPWIELRGSIPLGLAWNLPWYGVALVAVAANVLVFVPTYAALALLYDRWLSRTFVRALVERARRRGQPLIARHGTWGLALFVAVPLPGTGAYSGTALAFLLGLPANRAFGAVAAGVVLAGMVVTLVSTGVLAGVRSLM
ncbi:hypothetical protein LIP_2500 [Limnochorda pilosa]|uniref:Small multidrug export protein n=1 Tax=Limnochorda pilosa TaxID=1555112 RepID=A0A0K2SMJ5_LIMPI|nr:hypothetical protein LIP_2500 [Limnochorda pilosa]